MPSRINPYTGEVVLTELPSGLAFAGRTNSGMTPANAAIVCAQLAGYGDDYFNNHFYMQVIKAAHELLAIDVAPTPADFAAGATLTGATSLKTCVVVAKLTSTTYIVKSRSGTFTDGEVISDGTNSRDCGTGFPTFTAAAAPEHEVRKITDYVSATGTFTVDAYTQVVDPLSEILVLHESLVYPGRVQIKGTTINLQQAAAAYTLFTGTTQDIIVDKLTFRLPNVNVSNDATITSIAIATDDATPQVMISAAQGAKANLPAEAQIPWTGAVLLKVGKKIKLTIAGGAADAAIVCDVVAEFRAVIEGGYLA
ncbi:MAG: hypothetical protein NT047_07545 [Deltaproteobacteria bacterium]|nr:hypothetical protein [Deltaproteobacteria bacterium]